MRLALSRYQYKEKAYLRKKFLVLIQIRKTSSEEQQNAKRVAELLGMPVAKNLHKPLEPVKVSSIVCRDKGLTDDKESCLSPRKKRRDSLAKGTILGEENERSSSQKDLEGLRVSIRVGFYFYFFFPLII